MIKKILKASRQSKQMIMMLSDFLVITMVMLASFSLRLGYLFLPEGYLLSIVLVSPFVAIAIFYQFGLYRAIVRFIGFKALWSIAQASTLFALIWGVFILMSKVPDFPRSVILINWMLTIVAIGGSRMIARWLIFEAGQDNYANSKNVIIYGSGSAGRQLSIALKHSDEYNPVALIDDSVELQKKSIMGLVIYSPEDLDFLIKQKQVVEILLAMPKLSRGRQKNIINALAHYPVIVRSLPSWSELAKGNIQIADLREINIKDLLGRESIAPNIELLTQNITGKVIMITGAGGSIGSELCRQILSLKAETIILFELNEFALYSIDNELKSLNTKNVKIIPVLGSITSEKRLSYIINKFKVNTIFHAAAYKHVPLVELNDTEGAMNNIFGTLNCAKVAIEQKVETFVLISTDKAVRPTSTMGSSKRIAEMILQAFSKHQHATKFTMVRFGNVLGSSGSVIPLFKKQIKEGGPITITDSKMIRFFMTIPEAVELVIQAGAMGKGGSVLVLDMGKPLSILALAIKMVHLSGLEIKDKSNPNGDIEIQYTGLRPGEKLYEELLIGENVSATEHPMIMSADEKMIDWDELKPILDEIEVAIQKFDQHKLRSLLVQLLPEFTPQSKVSNFLS